MEFHATDDDDLSLPWQSAPRRAAGIAAAPAGRSRVLSEIVKKAIRAGTVVSPEKVGAALATVRGNIDLLAADLQLTVEEIRRQQASLASERMHVEICADVVCVNWLWTATITAMLASHNEEPNPPRLMIAITSMFRAFALVNLCDQVAEDCSTMRSAIDQIQAEYRQYALRIGFDIRHQISGDFVLRRVLRDLGSESLPGAQVALRQVQDRYEQMLSGFEFAVAEAYRYSDLSRPTLDRRDRDAAAAPPRSRRGTIAGFLRGATLRGRLAGR